MNTSLRHSTPSREPVSISLRCNRRLRSLHPRIRIRIRIRTHTTPTRPRLGGLEGLVRAHFNPLLRSCPPSERGELQRNQMPMHAPPLPLPLPPHPAFLVHVHEGRAQTLDSTQSGFRFASIPTLPASCGAGGFGSGPLQPPPPLLPSPPARAINGLDTNTTRYITTAPISLLASSAYFDMRAGGVRPTTIPPSLGLPDCEREVRRTRYQHDRLHYYPHLHHLRRPRVLVRLRPLPRHGVRIPSGRVGAWDRFANERGRGKD